VQPAQPSLWSRLSRWPRELLGVIGTVYLFPLAILVIFVPLAFAIKGLIMGAGWALNALR
jgi:hypothetical protein